jgi:hypothetical protein
MEQLARVEAFDEANDPKKGERLTRYILVGRMPATG